jgi:hypothetical protein
MTGQREIAFLHLRAINNRYKESLYGPHTSA